MSFLELLTREHARARVSTSARAARSKRTGGAGSVHFDFARFRPIFTHSFTHARPSTSSSHALPLLAPCLDAFLEGEIGDELFGGERKSAERIRGGVEKMALDDASLHHHARRKTHRILHQSVHQWILRPEGRYSIRNRIKYRVKEKEDEDKDKDDDDDDGDDDGDDDDGDDNIKEEEADEEKEG